MNQSLILKNVWLWQMFQEHYTTANTEETQLWVSEINDRESMKQGKSSISLFCLPSRLVMSQRPKSQYMKSNFDIRKDVTHTKKFHKIVNVMIYIEESVELAFRNNESTFSLLFKKGWDGTSSDTKLHGGKIQMGDWKDFWIWQCLFCLVVYKHCGLVHGKRW